MGINMFHGTYWKMEAHYPKQCIAIAYVVEGNQL